MISSGRGESPLFGLTRVQVAKQRKVGPRTLKSGMAFDHRPPPSGDAGKSKVEREEDETRADLGRSSRPLVTRDEICDSAV